MYKKCALCGEQFLFVNALGACARCEAIIAAKRMSKAKVIWLRDGKRCRYCGRKITLKETTLDHFVPKSKGGKGDYYNLVSVCKACNGQKSNLSLRKAEMVLLQVEGNFFKGGV